MHTLYFAQLSQFDRTTDPVSVSRPFAAGVLFDRSHLTITMVSRYWQYNAGH